jgi:hypothetical protein
MNGILAPSPRKLPLICTLAASCSFAASNSAMSETHQPAGSVWMAVSDDALDDMRGGFDFGGGLVLNFGIDRAVYINGALVTSTSITFNNLSDLKPEQLALLNKYAPVVNLIQNGPGNTFQPPPHRRLLQHPRHTAHRRRRTMLHSLHQRHRQSSTITCRPHRRLSFRTA